MREPGFYWVDAINGSGWYVAEWTASSHWKVTGDWQRYDDSTFKQIDERRITRLTSDQYDVLIELECDHDWRSNSGYAVCIRCGKREDTED